VRQAPWPFSRWLSIGEKAKLFDDYARRSDIAEAPPDAVDISDSELARRVVAMEQERLARGAIASEGRVSSANDHCDLITCAGISFSSQDGETMLCSPAED
jgi:hypothetical protein